ncbi:Aste57867_18384 [Aphanomyces stellatus]|uniref:Aste57867_18384 protein n=1 Tax=Aphanomyces stellatus TaxID=120398 RepID=A0A485LBD7_9STRA|nr:hypothetical protein As57867_018322 [Aphanomyces stellatus]VFT95120.1 Aste57867_18384 [Aphanomyces stellatus]
MSAEDAFNLFGGPPASNNPSKEVMNSAHYASLFPMQPKKTETTSSDDNPFDLFPSASSHANRQDLDELDELFPTKHRDASSRPAPPPAAVPAPSPVMPDDFKKSGNAMDIVFARNESGTSVGCTPWHVAFSSSPFQASSTGDKVDVFVNGAKLTTSMYLTDKGRCQFASGLEQPDDMTLAAVSSILPLDHPPLYALMRFEHRKPNQPTSVVRVVECRLFVWGPDDAVVVADLDGTITKNDVEGHIRTLRLGQHDFVHAGVCDFYARLHQIGLRVLYLTARPINWADASREHLDNVTQGQARLPPGPLLTNSMGMTGALWTEVVHKNPNVFKASVLNSVQMACIAGGRVSPHPVFVAGFGNRPTDVQAYADVGIDRAAIFLIDPASNLRAVESNCPVFASYADPHALVYLLPRLKHKVPLAIDDALDAHEAYMLVAADEYLQRTQRTAFAHV